MATYKFFKLGSYFKWKVDEQSYGPAKVTTAEALGSQMVLVIGTQRFVLNEGIDKVYIEGIEATGTMEEIRDRLLIEVFDKNFIVS